MASEIRVNRLSNRSGLSTITFANGGVQFSGITTFANGDFRVGTGATILNPSANEMQFHTGGSNRLTINNSGANLGTGNITAVDATFTGNVSIGKTLTYEDVKNVDSVGVVTARTGVKVTGGDFTVGTAITASSVTGNVTNDVGITTYSGSAVWFKGATANKDMYWSHSSGATVYKDNAQILMGDSSDLQIFHAGGTANKIKSGANTLYIAADDLQITNKEITEPCLKTFADGAVELYYNNSKKIETTTSGVDVTGIVQCDEFKLLDNEHAKFGTGEDLRIYHDSSHSWVKNSTGYLRLAAGGSGVTISNADNTQAIAQFVRGGSVDLYHNNSLKFATTSTGISITGIPVATQSTGNVGLDLHATGSGRGSQTKYHNDHGEAYVGTAGDTTGNLLIHNSSNSHMLFATNNTEVLRITSGGHVYHTGGGNGRRYSFAGDGSSHYMKHDTTLNGIILNGYGGIAFETNGTNERLRITSDGKVGINETNPDNTLHIHGASTNCVKWVRTGSSLAGYLYSDGGGSGITGSGGNINEVGMYMINNNRIDFRVNGSERLRINNLGEVTIGTGNAGTSMSEFGSNTGGLTLDDIGVSHTGLRLSHGSDDTYLIQGGNNNFYLSSYLSGSMIFGVGSSGNERFRINASGAFGLSGANYGSSGQVITSGGSGSTPSWASPSLSSESIQAEQVTDQTMGTNAWNLVKFNAQNWDTGNNYDHNNGNWYYQAPSTGKYWYKASAKLNDLAADKEFDIALYKSTDNGGSYTIQKKSQRWVFTRENTASVVIVETTGLMALNANDRIRVYVWHNHGSNRTLDDNFCLFEVFRLGD